MSGLGLSGDSGESGGYTVLMGTTPAELEALRLKVESGMASAAEIAEYQLKDGTRVRRPDPNKLNELRKDLAAEEAAASGGFFTPVEFGDPH